MIGQCNCWFASELLARWITNSLIEDATGAMNSEFLGEKLNEHVKLFHCRIKIKALSVWLNDAIFFVISMKWWSSMLIGDSSKFLFCAELLLNFPNGASNNVVIKLIQLVMNCGWKWYTVIETLKLFFDYSIICLKHFIKHLVS